MLSPNAIRESAQRLSRTRCKTASTSHRLIHALLTPADDTATRAQAVPPASSPRS